MGKNILIFSDGTGQAGGLFPDERRSNVYKLFRATRCGPDSSINPDDQLAFYDPGLGSASDAEDVKIGFFRKIYNVLSQATGLGITKNIIDCYTAIIQAYEEGDRIFLFGFSRGAYTARCVGGVLAKCGVPTMTPTDGKLRRDSKSARRVATEAVKSVYQHGAGRSEEKFKRQRNELAVKFRERYGSSNDRGEPNVVPYFIGVWDTVAALGVNPMQQMMMILVATLSATMASAVVWALFWPEVSLTKWLLLSLVGLGVLVLAWYLATHVKSARGLTAPWWKTLHITGWRMRFYDTLLNSRVMFAKHALSIDENRATFARVAWTNTDTEIMDGKADDWFEQMWFAGVHSDVGGSYLENESRLSDIALKWMADKATLIPHPIIIDYRWLNLFPSAKGLQHDEIRSGRLAWKLGVREIEIDAPLHPSVLERFKLQGAIQFDELREYRPEALRNHKGVAHLYTSGPPQATPSKWWDRFVPRG
ncbi:DUF2235 domain-containing protein [Rhizobium laguerreae]|uniref:DUF2235 domain-containing protein n=1 Tax=Rhizobium laguerreae TaxID=1076926 RepID=UPI001C91A4BE|nr:DUF2235 domain-containing protein [Rhizobium laguerreae]MBY3328788.1 DUF2235 domain-containing protein [Rhizobium laguerreae]